MTSTPTGRLATSLVVALALPVSGAVALNAGQISRPRQTTTTAPSPAIPATQAGPVAARLYLAVLGRDGDAAGLRSATTEIQRGRINNQVAAMVTSAEFRQNVQPKPASDILAQFCQGLLGRNPDPAGMNAFLPRLGRGEYTGVILEMLGSPEFRETLAASPANLTSELNSFKPISRVDAALLCQAKVITAYSGDVPGRRVFISFDQMPEISQELRFVSGSGVDRLDNNRTVTYRCENNAVSFSHDDRRAMVGADPRENFGAATIDACIAGAAPEFRGVSVRAATMTTTDIDRQFFIQAYSVVDSRPVYVVCELDYTRIVSIRRR